ncbi:MAG: hypothetical protein JNM39_00180 [Bdellovibrionaceae bacterium]|nr:hypothetical protein [Pseudobdellovibrionaceae bacterium]
MKSIIKFAALGISSAVLGLSEQGCARSDAPTNPDSIYQGQNSWVSCTVEQHLTVFKFNYSALAHVNDFEGNLVPDLIESTSTLFLSYTYENRRWIAFVKLNKDCAELDHGSTPIKTIGVFGSNQII